MIIRKGQGEVLAAKARRKEGLVNVVGAELMGAVEGLEVVRDRGFSQ